MTIEYTIQAIPTVYNGIRYRSRLEAKWAAFFDVLKWKFEYEPCDLGLWSPDFLLIGFDHPILCEIKPIQDIDLDTCLKMGEAAKAASFDGELLLLGLSPDCPRDGWLGWLDDSHWNGLECFGDFEPCWMVDGSSVNLDFCHSVNSYAGRMSGAWDGDHFLTTDRLFMRELWAKATNAVQWRGRDG